MTARPLVPATRVIRRFFPRSNLARRARDTVCTEILKQEETVLNRSIIFA